MLKSILRFGFLCFCYENQIKKEASIVVTSTTGKAREQEIISRTREGVATKQEQIQIIQEKVNGVFLPMKIHFYHIVHYIDYHANPYMCVSFVLAAMS